MNKKTLLILVAAVVIVAGGLYIFVFSSPDGEKPPVRAEYWPDDFIIVNVLDSTYLLKAGIVLVVDDEGILDSLAADNMRIRDTLNAVMSSVDLDTLLDVSARDYVKGLLADAVNERLEITNVIDIYFSEYVIQ
ncbi:MAG: flagellar basal body-associated FliL family protein [Oscillospiraceae bacterium]|jgi:flagellar basal body-associated protein FliL|nr:flagellar basal body-associated FliL family protein [Oscillospiraceae bacterium]